MSPRIPRPSPRPERIDLPSEVRDILRATASLRRRYPDRKFSLDGHLVGNLGEVIAREAFGLTLLPESTEGHDAMDAAGCLVQIKLVGATAKAVALYSDCDFLLVMRLLPEGEQAEVLYFAPGAPVWAMAGKAQKNGQRKVALSRIAALGG